MASMSELIAEHAEPGRGRACSGCGWSCRSGSCWPTSRSPTSCCGCPTVDENVFWAVAQIRPTTGPTALLDDVVGDLIAYSPEHLVSEAFMSAEDHPDQRQTSSSAGIPVETHAIPVVFGDRVDRRGRAAHQPARRPRAELAGTGLSGLGARIWPRWCRRRRSRSPGDPFDPSINPRVGDGFIRLDADGDVVYASPNALSAYRRLGLRGDLVDEHLADLTGHPDAGADGPVRRLGAVRPARGPDLAAGRGGGRRRPPAAPFGAAGQRAGAARGDRALPRRLGSAQQGARARSPRTRPSARSITG